MYTEGESIQRLYKRVNGKCIPCAWLCPHCGLVKKDKSWKRSGNAIISLKLNAVTGTF